MSFIINQNFDLKSPQFNFERDYFASLADLKAAPESNFPDFFITNVAGVQYQLNKSNSVDATTGKWRKFNNSSDIKSERCISIENIDSYFGDKSNPVTLNVIRETVQGVQNIDGSLTVYQDTNKHVVYQEYTTSTCPDTSQDDTAQGAGVKLSIYPWELINYNSNIKLSPTGAHSDGIVYKYVRIYNIGSSYLTKPVEGEWSDWKLIDWYDLQPNAPELLTSGVAAALKRNPSQISDNEIDALFKITDSIDADTLNSMSYGVEWTEGTANSSLTRVGNMSYHKTLPIQSRIRGCVHQHGKIKYYLDPNDWSKKADGTASRLDGYDGEVGLEIPKFYIWSYNNDGTCGVRIAKNKFVPEAKEAGGYILAPWCASLLREVPENMGYLSTLPKNSFVCIKNDNAYCRGGNNDATYDTYYTAKTDIYRSQLNKPSTAISRASARMYAKNGGNLLLGYHEYKDLVWLYYIEYANFDCQATYNSTPTSEGYKQGGLGAGCTNFNWNNWTGYNANYPLIPNGEFCEKFGNNTGYGGVKIPSFSYEKDGKTVEVAAAEQKCAYYRGIQNFFGDCFQNLDRILSVYNADDDKRDVYTTDDTEFADNVSKMTKIFSISATDGWINTLYVGNSAELLPDQVDSSSSSKSPVKDYCHSNNDTSNHLFLVGGGATHGGGAAGLACSRSDGGLGAAASSFAFRTITKIKE